MNRRNTILISIFAALIVIGAIASYFSYQNSNKASSGDASGSGSFSFGDAINSAGTGVKKTGDGDIGAGNPASGENNTATGTPVILEIISKNDSGATIPTTGGIEFDMSTTSIVRYMERGTGHIYERDFSSTTPLTPAREITNTTIPRIYETIWNKRGDALYARYTGENSDTINTYYAKLQLSTSTPSMIGSLDGKFLDTNMNTMVLGGKDKIFVLENIGGRGAGIIQNTDGSKGAQIFDSALTEWTSEWPKEDTITLTTKASSVAPGFFFFLKASNGTLQKMLGGVNGLTTLTSPDAAYVLFSRSDLSTGFELDLLNTKTLETSIAPVRTLSEKCIWSRTESAVAFCFVPQTITVGSYPDAWYQGIVSFSDEIWKINVKTGESRLLAGGKDLKDKNFDGIKPMLSQKEDYLFFTDKEDMTFWSLKLN